MGYYCAFILYALCNVHNFLLKSAVYEVGDCCYENDCPSHAAYRPSNNCSSGAGMFGTDLLLSWNQNELPHVKTNKVACAPSEDSDQPGHRPVWSESLLCIQWVAKNPSFLYADSEDADRTGRMPRLIWVFGGRTCHFVGFSRGVSNNFHISKKVT